MKNLKTISFLFVYILFLSLYTSCSNNDDTNVEEPNVPVTLENEVNDFVWSGLNFYYLWQDDVPNLADDKFSTQDEFYTFLNSYNAPEDIFDALLYKKDEVDKFSFLVDDYVELENSFQGTSKTNGLDFRLVRLSGSDDIFGYVRYVANNSDAASKDIKRGDFFLTVDSQQLTINNYTDLLFGANDSYTLGMASITNSTIASNGKTVALTKTDFTESPIHINNVIETNGVKVGYLMYNQFIRNFETGLNDAFTQLKAEGVSELVLDLRYNPGGSVATAVSLAGMITGQFEGQIFYKNEYNSRIQEYYEVNRPDFLVDKFRNTLTDGSSLTNLNLNKVYVLTTSASASASELIINCLTPYIEVVHIGTNTTGKFHGSFTLYDSPNFTKDNVNPNHSYAIQPLTVKLTNVNGVSDYYDGLVPNHIITYQTSSGSIAQGENIVNLGVLGDMNEPFLAKALSLITGGTTKFGEISKSVKGIDIEPITDSKDFTPLGKGMFFELKTME
ncbi:S41 family peptidase [Tamlana sp. 2201CG12-4]|uniref:S41 family peptidase n=1 Tax=Tamlana sp. 2201CG12-4 TaxID=3112582 RepID=UPI002DBAD379|nr:S41 family peptidase [Tamlana sp. 2201CG12-4]MEC3908386.1 S41 family peptidase [Tamlana sp. 2201CG12-4]